MKTLYTIYTLRDRFQMFQQCVLNGEHVHLIIDRAQQHSENVKRGEELNEQIQKQLQELPKQK